MHRTSAGGESEIRLQRRLEGLSKVDTIEYIQIKRRCRNGPLITECAILEWNEGNVDSARALFHRGSELTDIHIPLLEAWQQMESAMQNQEEADRLQREIDAATTEQKQRLKLKSTAEIDVVKLAEQL